MGKSVNFSTKLNKKRGFFGLTVYGMKKNYDICTAKTVIARFNRCLSRFKLFKQDKHKIYF